MNMRFYDGELPYFGFDAFLELSFIKHMFTARRGGVSQGYYKSLNLKSGLSDPETNVRENFNRVAGAMGCSAEDLVLTDQTHTARVIAVGESDRGAGLIKERGYHDVDGLVTDTRGLVLSVFSADCLPLIFADSVKKCIGAAHSGWRGSVKKIALNTIKAMQENYGSDPADIICGIGPAICGNCYEVSDEVAREFEAVFPDKADQILRRNRPGHFLLDLKRAVAITMEEAGVRKENIHISDICTCENPDLLFSHRASHGKRGVQGAFIMIRD